MRCVDSCFGAISHWIGLRVKPQIALAIPLCGTSAKRLDARSALIVWRSDGWLDFAYGGCRGSGAGADAGMSRVAAQPLRLVHGQSVFADRRLECRRAVAVAVGHARGDTP